MHLPSKLHQDLRPLLALSRDLLQSDDAIGTLELVGKAMTHMLRIDYALLILLTHEARHLIGFGKDGMAFRADSQHPLYLTANAAAGPTAFAPSVLRQSAASGTIELAAIPPASPTAVLAAAWRKSPYPRLASERQRVLGYIAELAAAAMAKIEVRTSLERLIDDLEQKVAAQRDELVDKAHAHASEIARRDVAEREMRLLALTDVLTGMNNRRGFLLFAEQAFKAARRLRRPSAVIFADVDGLKRVNDREGHDVGDQLLRDAANVFRSSFRAADIVGRMGGDEFAAYTLNDDQPGVVLARIRGQLEAFNSSDGSVYQLSFSTGIVMCDPGGTLGLADYLLMADQKMYTQKRALRQ